MNPKRMDRRRFLGLAGSALLLAAAPQARGSADDAFARALAELESQSGGGRLGVALVGANGDALGRGRADERFPLCSTFKALLAGAILAGIDAGRLQLEARVPIREQDLVAHSPVTGRHVGAHGLSLGELCAATITTSDNAAANLLLPYVGGPYGLTRFLRQLGDSVTRLDRYEPGLNSALPGDMRDTTTPNAMLHSLHALLVGPALRQSSRRHLSGWLFASITGGRRLRAGFPASWMVGDKTGSGARGTTNDVAVVVPPGEPPFLLASYLTGSSLDAAGCDAIHAAVGALAYRRIMAA